MNVEATLELAREGRLYPSVILHGGEREGRIEAALELGRTLLCEAEPAARPCSTCRHCRRIVAPGDDSGFHPDFRILERDLRTSTSVEATKALLRLAQVRPFEARGQVFVIADAETLTDSAANALLKTLEEPPESAPRNFFLLTPSAADLLPTLRSRSLQIYLGLASAVDEEEVAALAEEIASRLDDWTRTPAPVHLLALARTLGQRGGFEDPRSAAPFNLGARALVAVAQSGRVEAGLCAALLELSEALLLAPEMRVRAIQPARILEGLVSRYLGPLSRTQSGARHPD